MKLPTRRHSTAKAAASGEGNRHWCILSHMAMYLSVLLVSLSFLQLHAAAYQATVSHLFERDPDGTMLAFADMMRKVGEGMCARVGGEHTWGG